MREYLGSPVGKGSKPVSINGFVPDLPVGGQYGVTDIKNVKYLTNSDQLRAFYQYAASNEMPFNIIISPKTQSVSNTVLDQIRNTNGKLFEFNLDKQSLNPIDIGVNGAWKR